MKGGSVSAVREGSSATESSFQACYGIYMCRYSGEYKSLSIEGGTVSAFQQKINSVKPVYYYAFGGTGSAIVKNAVFLTNADVSAADAVYVPSVTSAIFYNDPAPDDDVYVGKVLGSVTLQENLTLAGSLTIPAYARLTVPAGTTLTIPAGTTLTLEGGAALTVAGGGTLVNNGTIVNGGTITHNGAYAGGGNVEGAGAFSGAIRAQAPPAAPTLASKTYDRVVLNAAAGCVYSSDGISWQADPAFSGLAPGTSYSFYQRYAGSATLYPSPKSPALTVATDPAPAAEDKTTAADQTAASNTQAAPPKTKITKLAPGKRLVKVTFRKVPKALKVTRYQIQYRVKGAKKWQSKSFTVKAAGAATAKVTVKKLKKGKRYQFRVRAWKTAAGKKLYAPWSAVKPSGKVK
jgi:hypothetical protein